MNPLMSDATEQAAVVAVIEEVVVAVPTIPEVTSVIEWRKKARARWRITLPSGNVIEAKRPDMTALIGDSVIDSQALMTALQAVDSAARYRACLPLARAAVPYILLAPKLSTDGTVEDGLIIDEIPNGDLVALFLWSGGWNATVNAVQLPD